MALGKHAFTRAMDGDYRQGIAAAVHRVSMTTGTEDSQEGLRAFVEKRKPVWKKPERSHRPCARGSARRIPWIAATGPHKLSPALRRVTSCRNPGQ